MKIKQVNPRFFFYHEDMVFENLTRLRHGQLIHSGIPSIFFPFGNYEEFHARLIPDNLSYAYNPAKAFISRRKISKTNKKASQQELHSWTPLMVLYTEKSRGKSLPALLCHKNILHQQSVMSRVSGINQGTKFWVNQAPDEPSGLIQGVSTVLAEGGTAIITHQKHLHATLHGMNKHRITHLMQSKYQFKELLKENPPKSWLGSSLQYGIVKDSAPESGFYHELKELFPKVGGGMSLTEAGGFTTFYQDPVHKSSYDLIPQGKILEGMTKVSIRKPMKMDGNSGEVIPISRDGEMCVHPPSVFLGYFNDPQQTAQSISKDGLLYTGIKGRIYSENQEMLLFTEHSEEGSNTGMNSQNTDIQDKSLIYSS